MVALTLSQRTTLNDIQNAPEYYCEAQWCDTFKRGDGTVNGNWNTLTLKSLEKKGFINIVKVGNFWNDVVQLV